ncbi:MAG TPA: SusC/RagA family TonB-linked outer membrane protein [Chitinophagaceae bacterium]
MRKFVTAIMAFLFIHLTYLCNAQTIPVTGRILSKDNTPVVGATVLVKGKKTGTKTDVNGTFTINANKGDILIISSVGHTTQQVKVTGSTLDVNLSNADKILDEVVVTAMDIKKNPRELGTSIQTISGNEIAATKRENFINGLQGRVAGITVTPTSGVAGSSSGIVLRGYNTMSGSNQPLFIVDGIILDNQTLNSNSQGGSGIGLASDLPNRNNDYTNRMADLNPNDIESISVLKGPEATALYGSQASSGAIVITTKKARSTNGKIRVTYDDNFRLQKITRFAKIDDNYGPGTNGVPPAPPITSSTTQYVSFGPAYPSNTKKYDNLHNFYQTGFSQTHNLGLEFGGKNSGYRFSSQYFDDHGVVPHNTYTKYNFKLSNNTKIGKYIDFSPSISYINADNVKPLKGANSYLLDLYMWPSIDNMQDYQLPNGDKKLFYGISQNGDYDNPLWSAKNNISGDQTDRWVATMSINIRPFPWLTLAGRFGYDTYKTDGYLFTHPESFYLAVGTGGTLDNYYRTYKGYNHTITAAANKKFGDFTTRLMVGTMWEDFETQQYSLVGNHLKDSTSTDSSNTLASSRTRLLRNTFGLPNLNTFRELAYFGETTIGFRNLLFLTYSQRFEIVSTLPAKNRNYNYPAASLSTIVTDIFPGIKGKTLGFAKLRASLANTARLNDPYSNQSVFVNNQYSSTIPAFSYGYINANEELGPERQQTYEVGTELRMFNNSLSIDAAYYNTLCTNQISQGYRASYATGFVLNTGNVSSLRNEGVEISIDVTPIKKKDFDWNIRFNFNHMWSKVLTIPESIGPNNDYYNSDTWMYGNARGGLVRGHSTGTITGFGYQRNTAGQILINPTTGIPLVDANFFVRGDRTPDFTLGTLNSFRYKNWTFSFLWDLKVGGDIYNATDQYLNGLGKSERESDRMTPIVVDGVLNDGLQNSNHPTKNTIIVNPYYTQTYYTLMPEEEFIQKNVNWLRLRDLTFSYMFPEKKLQKIKGLKGLSAFITGNDLILITNYQGADPAVNGNNPGTTGVGGYGFDFGNAPTPLSLSFGLRANF